MRRHAATSLATAVRHRPAPICQQCARTLTTSTALRAGHNKWSKTKNIKAVTDRKKTSERTNFAKLIATCSRMYGDNPEFNPSLASAVIAASKASIPKQVIENAIARGQGRTVSGVQLEPLTLEVLIPPNIALIIDAETDNKNRTMHDLKYVAKKNSGVAGSTAFYFSKRGRAVFRAPEGGASLSDVLDEAIEHEGTEDVEELADGSYLAWTQPAALMAVTKALAAKFDLEVLDSDIVWAPNEDTKVDINVPLVEILEPLLSGLRDYTEVKAIYANIRQGTVPDDKWQRIEKNIDT